MSALTRSHSKLERAGLGGQREKAPEDLLLEPSQKGPWPGAWGPRGRAVLTGSDPATVDANTSGEQAAVTSRESGGGEGQMGPRNVSQCGKDGRGEAGGGGTRRGAGMRQASPNHGDCWLLDQRPDTILRLPGFYKLWQEERGGHRWRAPPDVLRGS